jgi:hypothetical protein
MLLGYARVSKGGEQNNALQTKALKAAGCRRLFEEAASGGRWDRPELRHLRNGDTVVVWKLDRLSRSLRDVLHIMERIARGWCRVPVHHGESTLLPLAVRAQGTDKASAFVKSIGDKLLAIVNTPGATSTKGATMSQILNADVQAASMMSLR